MIFLSDSSQPSVYTSFDLKTYGPVCNWISTILVHLTMVHRPIWKWINTAAIGSINFFIHLSLDSFSIGSIQYWIRPKQNPYNIGCNAQHLMHGSLQCHTTFHLYSIEFIQHWIHHWIHSIHTTFYSYKFRGLGKWTTCLSVSSGILVYIYMWVIFKLLSEWCELYWRVLYENVISF